jgi:hypothetical protein
MNNTNFQNNTRLNRYLLSLFSFVVSGAALLIAERAIANNAVLRSIFSCQAQGLGGSVPAVTVWYERGTNLSFINTGETIKKVWLDDPRQVVLDFDGPMCLQFGQENGETGDCENSAATVIHMRRIQKIKIPGIPDTDSTLLTVVTEKQGQRKLYTFTVNYGEGSPEYKTLAVFPDPAGSGPMPCVRPGENSDFTGSGAGA